MTTGCYPYTALPQALSKATEASEQRWRKKFHAHGAERVESAYALRTRNESMVPRYFPNEILYINPEQTPQGGDHIIIQVQLHESDGIENMGQAPRCRHQRRNHRDPV